MNKNSQLWGSISLLIGAVIAVLAFVRGTWQLPLLIGVFAVWGLWLVFALLFPAWRSIRDLRRREKRAERERHTIAEANLTDDDLARKLLNQVNYRVSAYLHSVYPNARWEWMTDRPMAFAATGGTARIRLYGVADYDYADVVLDQRGGITCSLIKVASVLGETLHTEEPAPPNQQPFNPQVWYETQGRQVLEELVADLDSRGHNQLFLKEDGNICTQPSNTGEETVEKSFRSFPEKVYWPMLAKILDQAGLSATVKDTCIQVSW